VNGHGFEFEELRARESIGLSFHGFDLVIIIGQNHRHGWRQFTYLYDKRFGPRLGKNEFVSFLPMARLIK